MAGVVVDAADDPTNYAFVFPPMQCGIDGGASAQIGKVGLGEGPSPTIAIDSTKYLLFNSLLHSGTLASARKNTTFFLLD